MFVPAVDEGGEDDVREDVVHDDEDNDDWALALRRSAVGCTVSTPCPAMQAGRRIRRQKGPSAKPKFEPGVSLQASTVGQGICVHIVLIHR